MKGGWEKVSATLKIIVIHSGMIRRCCLILFSVLIFFYFITLKFFIILLAINPLSNPTWPGGNSSICVGKTNNSLLWHKRIRETRHQSQNFPAWSPTIRKTEALKFGQGGHQSRTHQAHIPLKCSFNNNNNIHNSTWRHQSHLLNVFLTPRMPIWGHAHYMGALKRTTVDNAIQTQKVQIRFRV